MKTIISVLLLIAISWCCQNNNGANETDQEDALLEIILDLPERSVTAYSGSDLIQILIPLSLREREERVYNEIMSGNIPTFLRELTSIDVVVELDGLVWNLSYYVTPDYMAVGSDEDYFLIPMTPILAQEIADSLGLCLITRKMVDAVWLHAELQVEPIPIDPSSDMVTIPVFADHNELVGTQRMETIDQFPLGTLVAGNKKDVVLSNQIVNNENKVVIYGWHRTNGQPIQPLYTGHINWYADYSHGIRFAHAQCRVNGEERSVSDVLKDPGLYPLLSDEDGPMTMPRYPVDKSSYP